MKSIISMAAFTVAATLFMSCISDDNNTITEGTTGDVELYFDNGVAGNSLELGESYLNSNGEDITVTRLNYIVSNFVLIDKEGNEYVYPKNDSYFIINHENDMLTVHLENIPAGDYKQIRFGLGVDNARYEQGQAAQQEFWGLSLINNLGVDWEDGYRFINYEGTFLHAGSGHGLHAQVPFAVYQANTAGNDNYKEIALNLPTTARVREGDMPNIHLKTDVGLLLDGEIKIPLNDRVFDEHVILTETDIDNIAVNSSKMFVVDHVHNGNGHHE